jgi:hypothetical protein
MPTLTELKKDIADYIRLRLGDQMVDVEIDPEHVEMGIKQALIRYRQRAQNSTEESYAFLELVKEQTEYILPPEIITVKQIFRRGIGSVTGTTASQFEPFASGYLNTYMLVAGRVGGLTNYELFTQYQELAMKMFGGHINFTFDPVSRKLTIMRKIPENGESVLLWVYNTRPDHAILSSYQSFPWVQDYAYALSKYSLGEAREKFGTIPGPQGGSTLNGAALKMEAKELMDKLDDDLKNYLDGSSPMWFIIG